MRRSLRSHLPRVMHFRRLAMMRRNNRLYSLRIVQDPPLQLAMLLLNRLLRSTYRRAALPHLVNLRPLVRPNHRSSVHSLATPPPSSASLHQRHRTRRHKHRPHLGSPRAQRPLRLGLQTPQETLVRLHLGSPRLRTRSRSNDGCGRHSAEASDTPAALICCTLPMTRRITHPNVFTV